MSRSPRILAAAAGVGLLAACQLSVTVPPIGPSASPTTATSARPTETTAPPATPTATAPNVTPKPSTTPGQTRSTPPSPAATPTPGSTALPSVAPTASPSPGPSPDLAGTVLEIVQLKVENPYDVAVDPDGNLWVSTPNAPKSLHKLSPDGSLIASYDEGAIVDVAVDPQGRIRTAGITTGTRDRATGEVLTSYPVRASHLAFDAAGGLWTNFYGEPELIKLSPSGVPRSFRLAEREWNGGMAFDPEGNVWITGRKQSSPDTVWEILKVSPEGRILGRYPQLAMSVAFGAGQVANTVVNDTVTQLDLAGKPVGSFAFRGSPRFVDITPDGKGDWLLLDGDGARLYHVRL